MPPQNDYKSEISKSVGRSMGEEMGDIEFQMGIAPYTNYTSSIDPSRARYHGVKGLSGDIDLTLGGFYAPPDDENAKYTEEDRRGWKGRVNGIDIKIPAEPDTINAVHSKATDNIWAHEKRHKDYRGMSEDRNRLADGALAMNKSDWKSAVKFWKDRLTRKELLKQAKARKNGEKYTAKDILTSEAERDLIDELSSEVGSSYGIANRLFRNEFDAGGNLPESEETWHSPDERDYARMRREQTYWPKRKAELDKFDEWHEDLKERNKKRGPKPP
jgi:hypothetical protein